MVVWGIVSAAAGAVQNFAGLAAVRFFLGFVEVSFPDKFDATVVELHANPSRLHISLAVCSTLAAGTQEKSLHFAQLSCIRDP